MSKKRVPRLPANVDPDKVIWVQCLLCGYRWYPNPNKWKSTKKVLRCPSCRYRNKISSELEEKLREQTIVYSEWGRGVTADE